jgi:hypothetical protein
MTRLVKEFVVGKDFTEEEFNKWRKQLQWWVSETMPNVDDPIAHVNKILNSAMRGLKLNGEAWPLITNDFFSRVKQLGAFDLRTGTGTKKNKKGRPAATNRQYRKGSVVQINAEQVPDVDLKDIIEDQQRYKESLVTKYPHLDNPVYEPKVDELAELVIKSGLLSKDFLLSNGKKLESITKVRAEMQKQINEIMNFLEISPKLLLTKQKDAQQADVGSLIAKLENFGEHWQDFERIDALRELLQKYKQLNSLRPDGTPQLNDWELWHQTRNRPVHFKCRCGEEFDLLGGFTPEEIEQALIQAYEVYGFGLEGIEGPVVDDGQVHEEVLFDDLIVQQIEEEQVNFDETDEEKDSISGDGISV